MGCTGTGESLVEADASVRGARDAAADGTGVLRVEGGIDAAVVDAAAVDATVPPGLDATNDTTTPDGHVTARVLLEKPSSESPW